MTPPLAPPTSAPITQNIVGSNVGNTIIQQNQTIIQQTIIQQNIVAAPIPTPAPQVPWVTFKDAEFSIQYPSSITNVTPTPGHAAQGARFAIYGKGAAIIVWESNFSDTLDDAYTTLSSGLTNAIRTNGVLGGSPAFRVQGFHAGAGGNDGSFNANTICSIYGRKVFQISYFADASIHSDVFAADVSLQARIADSWTWASPLSVLQPVSTPTPAPSLNPITAANCPIVETLDVGTAKQGAYNGQRLPKGWGTAYNSEQAVTDAISNLPAVDWPCFQKGYPGASTIYKMRMGIS